MRTLIGAAVAALLASAAAQAQTTEASPSPIPANSPAAVYNATVANDLTNMQGTPVDRANEAKRAAPDVATGEVPNVYTPPPSNDRFHNPRTRTESSWTTQQRGTNATGMWPMPGTGGQPGTLQ